MAMASSLPPVRAAFPRMQVIILSAQNTLDTAVRASDTEAFEYFPKPFDLEELVRTVRQALGSNEAADLSGPTKELGQACRWSGAVRRCRRSTG
jgi:two-component system nitrogen regulation response regulator GlnG